MKICNAPAVLTPWLCRQPIYRSLRRADGGGELVIYDRGRVFALDNRCPHIAMGELHDRMPDH